MKRSANATLLEQQLADMLDLLISSLQCGVSIDMALRRIASEGEEPLRRHLEQLSSRLAFGESAEKAFGEFARRVPLEPYRLFALSMSIHWGSGGKLVPILTVVTKAIRDRVEISRYARVQSTQCRFSALGILLASYFIAGVIWQSNPVGFYGFLSSPFGSVIVSGAVALQGLGIVWISKMTEPRY